MKHIISMILTAKSFFGNPTASLVNLLFRVTKNKQYWRNTSSLLLEEAVISLEDLSEIGQGVNDFIAQYGHPKIDELKLFLQQVIKTKTIDNFVTDISNVDGLTARSTSAFYIYNSLHSFVENGCEKNFEVNEKHLKLNLKHFGIGIGINGSKATDHFKLFGWSEKLFIYNSDGTHHFAKAQYIAHKLSKNIYINGQMDFKYIDQDALLKFTKEYSSILMPFDDYLDFQKELDNSGLDFICFQCRQLNDKALIIIFYKRRSVPLIVDFLMKRKFVDFNSELRGFLDFQNQNSKLKLLNNQ